MPAAVQFEASSAAPEETETLARSVASILTPGGGLLICGAIGCGKTCFVRGVASALSVGSQVTSPTFSIVNIYETELAPLIHVDTYRLHTVSEFRGLALDELLESGIGLIEWGELVADELPWYHRLEIHLDGTLRRLVLNTNAPAPHDALIGWTPRE